ncbi:APA2 [Candida oxycetoniae]|uniref:APA2 n=1 Tax=Candida oxycetoniae TaxID=497107 RepID=A0AAI9WWD3_9ASCO|nr:APA2 [Candida oxycetoniae]KAI3403100.1 APA2 [Candida oxycetoniae]
MDSFDIPEDFYETLNEKYEQAVKNNHILFNGDAAVNELVKVKASELTIDFQLTLLTSLAHKPEQGDRESNPFEKPEPELTILNNYGPNKEFRVVFNKFPVVPLHFLLVTKEFQSQNSPLSPAELFASYKILSKVVEKSKRNNSEWFAFFNCGPESGASQPHKHIQFMIQPPPSMQFKPYAETLALQAETVSAKSKPFQSNNLPFAHFLIKLPDESHVDENVLATSFTALLQRTLTVLRSNEQKQISYNFIMTPSYMLMVPRATAKYEGKLGINSCGFQGLILCKNEELFEMVKQKGPLDILRAVGFPNTTDIPEDEYHY